MFGDAVSNGNTEGQLTTAVTGGQVITNDDCTARHNLTATEEQKAKKFWRTFGVE